jgi:hypothetical protein
MMVPRPTTKRCSITSIILFMAISMLSGCDSSTRTPKQSAEDGVAGQGIDFPTGECSGPRENQSVVNNQTAPSTPRTNSNSSEAYRDLDNEKTKALRANNIDENAIAEGVKIQLLDELRALTPRERQANTFAGYIFYGDGYAKSKETIIEFTINPEKLTPKCTALPQSQYDIENDRTRFKVEIDEGITIRAKLDHSHSILDPWSASESIAAVLPWFWQVEHTPESGVSYRQTRDWGLRPLPAEKLRFLYEEEAQDELNRIPTNVRSEFESAIKQFIIFPGRNEEFVGESTPRKPRLHAETDNVDSQPEADSTFYFWVSWSTRWSCPILNQGAGDSRISGKVYEVDEQGEERGVKHRGHLEYFFLGTQRHFHNNDSGNEYSYRWTPWQPSRMRLSCCYQVESDDSISWCSKTYLDTRIIREPSAADSLTETANIEFDYAENDWRKYLVDTGRLDIGANYLNKHSGVDFYWEKDGFLTGKRLDIRSMAAHLSANTPEFRAPPKHVLLSVEDILTLSKDR